MFASFILIFGIIIHSLPDTRMEKVLEKHKKSMSAGNMVKIESLELDGEVQYYLNERSFESKSPGLSGTFKEFIQLPDQKYYESSFNNVNGIFRKAYNGYEKWVIDGGGLKTSTLNESALLQAQLSYDITPNLLNLKERGFSYEYLGKIKLENQLYHCIKLTHEQGVNYYYLDPRYCLVRIIIFKSNELKEKDWTKRYYENYKLVDKIMFPHLQYEKLKMNNNITSLLHKYEHIKINNPIDPTIFKVPEYP